VTLGSVAPAEVDRLLAAARAEVERDTCWLMDERRRIAGSARDLEASVGAILGRSL